MQAPPAHTSDRRYQSPPAKLRHDRGSRNFPDGLLKMLKEFCVLARLRGALYVTDYNPCVFRVGREHNLNIRFRSMGVTALQQSQSAVISGRKKIRIAADGG